MTTRGWAHLFCVTLRMKWRSICSVTSKSVMTPSLRGRMALMRAGVRPSMRLASAPTAWTSPVRWSMATTDGSESTMPLAADVDEGVGGAEIDGHVARAEAREEVEETDELLLSVRLGRSCYTAPQAAPNR